MTIRKKLLMAGGISVLIFACFFVLNIKTYQKYQENIRVRNDANNKLAKIEQFAEWKDTFVNLVSNIAASGRVPEGIRKQFAPPSDLLKKETESLISAGSALISTDKGQSGQAIGDTRKIC